MMKKQFLLLLAAMAALVSCSKSSNSDVQSQTFTGVVTARLMDDGTGTVDGFDTYGMLVPSFTPSQLIEAGFDYSDLLNVQIGDSIFLYNVPFVTGFNEVGVLEKCFCDYNQLNTVYGFGQLHGNFKERIGGKPGDTIRISLAQHHGYYNTWIVMASVYYYDKDEYYPQEDSAQFANFREVTTSGMGRHILYRSSNPLNPKDNATRFAYVDTLARQHGIHTEIDLADTRLKVEQYATDTAFTKFGTANGYAYNELYRKGNTICLGLTADTYGQTFKETLADGLRFMITHEPPYLLHCNEGKDRCGFVSMLLEALAGATYEEVAADYMQTMINFYKVTPGDGSYELRQQLSIDRLVWLLQYVHTLSDWGNIDWSNKDPKTVNLHSAAVQYIRECGLSDAEIVSLQSRLQTGNK